jgi:hypothetical protein
MRHMLRLYVDARLADVSPEPPVVNVTADAGRSSHMNSPQDPQRESAMSQTNRRGMDPEGPQSPPWGLLLIFGSLGAHKKTRGPRNGGLSAYLQFRFLCFVCPIRFSKGNANAAH